MLRGALQRALEDLKSANLWLACLAEMIGTSFLVALGCASCLGQTWNHTPSTLQISLTFGLAVAIIVACINHISGGHINPAVSCAMLVARRITLVRCIFYIIAQCIGALIGAGIVKGITPEPHSGNLGLTTINPIINAFPRGVIVEAFVTFLLIFTIFACCDSNRRDHTGSIPLTIGLTVTLCHLAAIKYTGSSMNPARTFGPALVGNNWPDHWVYWVGPILGGVVASLLYDFLFAENACIGKLSDYARNGDYKGDAVYDARIDADAQKRSEVRNEQKKMIDSL